MRIRIGIVGLGLIAQVVHLPNLARLSSSFAVEHVCDLSASLVDDIAASLPGSPRRSTDWRALCDDPELDAVLILTPGAHAPIVAGALDAGKHVLTEKPLSITQAEALAVGEQAREHGLVLQVGYMKAYDPVMPAARAALAGIGAIRLVRVTVRHPSDERQAGHLGVVRYRDADPAAIAAAQAGEQERTREALGDAWPALGDYYRDVLLGSVSHELAAFAGLGLPMPAVYRYARAWPFDPGAASTEPPSLLTQADLGDDRTLDLGWLWLPDYPDYDERITILGETGAISLRMPQPYGPNVPASLHVTNADGQDARSSEVRGQWDSGFLHELRAFHASITSGAPVLADAGMSREITASMQALAGAIAAERGVAIGGEAASR